MKTRRKASPSAAAAKKRRHLRGIFLASIVVCLIPAVWGTPLYYGWATAGILWALWVLSLNVVWGLTGQFSLAQLGLGAVSGYTFAMLLQHTEMGPLGAATIGVVSAAVASLALSLDPPLW